MTKTTVNSHYSKSDLFIILYVSAYYLNESEQWINIISSSFSLIILILCLLFSKYRNTLFLVFLFFSTYFIFDKYPKVSNHSTLILFVNIYLIFSLLTKKLFQNKKLIISNNDFLVLRWTLIIVYFFRDPRRIIPVDDMIVSPADGLITYIGESNSPKESGINKKLLKISIFLNILM